MLSVGANGSVRILDEYLLTDGAISDSTSTNKAEGTAFVVQRKNLFRLKRSSSFPDSNYFRNPLRLNRLR
jgi:hypothetical protein